MLEEAMIVVDNKVCVCKNVRALGGPDFKWAILTLEPLLPESDSSPSDRFSGAKEKVKQECGLWRRTV